MLSGLPSTTILEISKHLDSTSTFQFAQSAREFYSLLATEAKTKRRRHHLRLATTRLRFLKLHLGNKEYIEPTTQWYFNLPREPLVMMCVIRLMDLFEYTGPPDYLMPFNPDSYDVLANLVLSYENHMNVCLANMYALVAAAPTEILLHFMFNFQELMLDDDDL